MTTSSISSRNLPVDILCEIFKYYIEDDHRNRPLSLMGNPKNIPWFLGQVCRLWRIAAVATPQLWDRFPPFRLTTANESLDNDLMFDELLKRSGTRSLSVQFDCTRYSPGIGNHIKSKPVFISLLATSKKWERATIRCPDVRSLEYYFSEIGGCIPSLRRVELLFPLDLTGGKSLEQHLSIFRDAPNLSELLLHDLPVTLWGNLPDIPWEQLTRLQYCGGGNGRFYEVLKRAVNLDTFMVAMFNFRDVTRPLLEHDKLRQLQVYVNKTETEFSRSLHNLKASALETLVVVFEPTTRYIRDVGQAIISLLVRSQCKLKHLVLSYQDLSDADVSGILAVTPDLETLELGDCAELNEALLSLVLEESGTPLLQDLRALTLTFPSTINPHQVTTIQRIVESRNQVISEGRNVSNWLCSPLQSVRLRIRHPSTRFQACLNLNKGRSQNKEDSRDHPKQVVDPTDLSDVPNTENCEALLGEFLSQIENSDLGITQQCDRAADAMRLAHVFNENSWIRSKLPTLRKICQPLVTDEFIKTCDWMLADKEDVVYIHSEHALRNSQNRLDIAFGLLNTGPESLEGYHATEFSAERREWWSFPC